MTRCTAIAVSGDVGAGKSTVSRLFEGLGGVLIDSDRVVADLWRRPDVIGTAVSRWGDGILDADGRVVHAKIAERIFRDRVEYAWVCSLLHPLVEAVVRRRIDAARPEREWLVVEIPLLFETGVASWVTSTVFVTAARSLRLERCRARGWDDAELTRREAFFLPSGERMALSDYVIHNDGDREALEAAVRKIADAVLGERPQKTHYRAATRGLEGE